MDYLKTHDEDAAIIYCYTRKQVEELQEVLESQKIESVIYPAGLSNKEREEEQNDFFFDRVNVVVATNAFGMGSDKSNMRLVINYNMPGDLENY
ncbi:hypothetical protein FE74_15260 [Staphylococcus aureus]|nr:hypothetical protein FE74_15260 [Staphylococcus aureus]